MQLLDTRHKKKSFTLTTILLSVLILLFFYIGLTYMEPPPESGITVNFGTMEFGMGQVQPTEPVRPQQQEPEVTETLPEEPPAESLPEPAEQLEETEAEQPAEEVLTQDTEESIRISQQQEAKRKAEEDARKAREEAERKAEAEAQREREEAQRIEREKREAEERARQEQEAKKRELDAMMGGLNNAQGQAEGSEGDDNRAGDKGDPGGDPYANTYYGGPGSGSGTGGYGLGGRTLLSKGQVQDNCVNEAGRVVVEVRVNRNGEVVGVKPGVKYSTTASPCLLEAAGRAAKTYLWNKDPKAKEVQVGFVVIEFKLGQ